MSNPRNGESETAILTGTTLRVYRYVYRHGGIEPQNLHDIQRGLKLSSASVAQYHIRKLLKAGLIREEGTGFVVDRIIFENMLRIRHSLIPFQVAYSVFFATMLAFLLIFLSSSNNFDELLVYSIVISSIALGLFLFETLKIVRSEY